ncbi:MAG: DnaA/Hda family protein [Pirellulales bacterium]
MVDYLTEIPLPGRRLAPPIAGAANRHTNVAQPTFVAGPENRLVAAMFCRLLDVARLPSATQANGARLVPAILALFGPSGTGKSHLAQGLVRYWRQLHGDESAEYVTATDFRREYAAAIRDDAILAFRRRVRARQLLAIDDLHHLPADEHLLQELRCTIDAYEEAGGTIVVTSARPASMLANMSPDLRSRLASGLMLQLTAPGTAARVRIIRHASTAMGKPLSDDAAHRLAAGITGTAPDLIGALFELCSAPPDNGISDASRAGQLLAARTARRPALRQIITIVARHTGIPQKQLKSGSRKQSIVLARAIVVYLARELAAASYHEIGRALGGRDHTTIMHNYRKIERDRLDNSLIQESLDELRRFLLNR